jgi:tetratricopeptide (TPR) repeat protein
MAKKKTLKRPTIRRPARGRLDDLEQADALIRRERWPEARDLLADLARRNPNEAEVWGRLVNVNYALNDLLGYQSAAEHLLALDPSEHDLRPALARAYLENGLPTLALRTFREFLRLAPDHPKAAAAREMVPALERGMLDLQAELGVSGGAGLKLAELHEEVQSCLNQGDFARARQVAQAALRQKPDIPPVLNNLTQAYAADGYLEEALATTDRVLAIEPDNVHALSNRARVLALLGRFDEGREVAQHMLASTADAVGGWLKKAEALAFLGLDQPLLDLFEASRRADADGAGGHDGVLWHLAAVAALRMGREREARAWWREALKREPGLGLARENLKDLDQPIGRRNGPWAYDLRYWLGQSTVRELQREFRAGRVGEAAQGPARRYLRRHPELIALVRKWLAHGSPDAREFALVMVETAATPELAQAAKDFALGQAGTDEQRLRAANLAVAQGALPTGLVQLWREGEWRESLLIGIEIHGEAVRLHEHHPQVERWLRQALEHMNAGEMALAETLLQQALAQEPDAPDLLNNLAATYAATGREAEAEPIWRGILERQPDYLFARASLGRIAAQHGHVAEARELLNPLLTRQRMHFSEFSTVAIALIETGLADGKLEEAKGWLQMWERAMPDDPRVEVFRKEIRRRTRRQN